MEELFLPYQESLRLKELGFNEPCHGRYWDGDFKLVNIDVQYKYPQHVCLAPLYQQAFRWFKEKHNLKYKFEPSRENTVDIFIWEVVGWEYFKTIDEKQADLTCLRKLIQIVKEDVKTI